MHPLMHQQHEGVESESGGRDSGSNQNPVGRIPAGDGDEDAADAESEKEGEFAAALAPVLRRERLELRPDGVGNLAPGSQSCLQSFGSRFLAQLLSDKNIRLDD